jgi:hypothetical protein
MGQWPTQGKLEIEWHSAIDDHDRLGWSYKSEPPLDPRRAIALLRDVAGELAMELPSPE